MFSTKTGPAGSQLKGGSRKSHNFVMQDSQSSMGDKTSITGDENTNNLGSQLGVVIEKVDGDSVEHSVPNSDRNLGHEQLENSNLNS